MNFLFLYLNCLPCVVPHMLEKYGATFEVDIHKYHHIQCIPRGKHDDYRARLSLRSQYTPVGRILNLGDWRKRVMSDILRGSYSWYVWKRWHRLAHIDATPALAFESDQRERECWHGCEGDSNGALMFLLASWMWYFVPRQAFCPPRQICPQFQHCHTTIQTQKNMPLHSPWPPGIDRFSNIGFGYLGNKLEHHHQVWMWCWCLQGVDIHLPIPISQWNLLHSDGDSLHASDNTY